MAGYASVQAASNGDETWVCVNFSCKAKKTIPLAGEGWGRVAALFDQPAPDAAAERQRISQAMGLMERHVGALAGTAADQGRNEATGTKGQLDCIAESTNTDHYLRLFEERGWLKWHKPKGRVKRAPWLIDVHWTAVIEEKGSGRQYAVDTWFFENGKPAYVLPLSEWYEKRDPP